jgi:Flp pilus assembly protein TadD
MLRTQLILGVVFCVVFSASSAFAAGGGGGGGAGGGLGGGGGSAPDLNKIFREGVELLSDGDCKKAEKKFRKVLRTVKRNPEANYLRGRALQCQEKHKAATRFLKKAIRYDDKMYVAYEKLGVSYLALGDEKAVATQLEKLDTLKQECSDRCPASLLEAQASLATAAAAVAGGQEAGEANDDDERDGKPHSLLFEEAVDPSASYLGAVRLINSERFEEAIEALRALAASIGPHPDVMNYLGYAHRRLGLFDRAQAYYEQALAIDPLHRGANEYLGELWVELGRFGEARKRLAALDQACPFGCAEYDDLRRVLELRVVANP